MPTFRKTEGTVKQHPNLKMTELAQSLKNRVYYAARDGMAITLYALLAEKRDEEVHELLNQVKFYVSINTDELCESWLTSIKQ